MTSEDIKSARAELGESQAEFARRFGVAQSTVHRWETRGIDNITRLAIESVLSKIQCSSGSPT
jgi:transcriptional regulator with XRE-family HTH domain